VNIKLYYLKNKSIGKRNIEIPQKGCFIFTFVPIRIRQKKVTSSFLGIPKSKNSIRSLWYNDFIDHMYHTIFALYIGFCNFDGTIYGNTGAAHHNI